jgi:hypothetical protein
MLEDLGDPEVVGQMRNALSGNDVSLADDIRETAIRFKDMTSVSMDVTAWRNASGKKLDRIRDAEIKLADSILAQAAEVPSNDGQDSGADGDEWEPVTLIVAVLVLLAAVGLAFTFGRRTARPRSE